MYWQLLANILLMYGIIIVANIPAPFLGLVFDDSGTGQRLRYEPPGYVIPIVWFVLFTMMGVARFIVRQRRDSGDLHWLILGLAIVCALYAYYTLGLSALTGVSALWFGLFGNLAVIGFAILVTFKLFPLSPTASFLILPVAIWTSFATTVVIGQMKAQRLI